MWRRADILLTDVSEERIAPILHRGHIPEDGIFQNWTCYYIPEGTESPSRYEGGI
jgi:hypothetical protein